MRVEAKCRRPLIGGGGEDHGNHPVRTPDPMFLNYE